MIWREWCSSVAPGRAGSPVFPSPMKNQSSSRACSATRILFTVIGAFALLHHATLAEEAGSFSFFKDMTPEVPNHTDKTPYDLGTAFTTLEPGTITAIRHWKCPSETGEHTGRIYSKDGKELATVTFTNESESGWQEAVLSEPLAIEPDTVYWVSVNINRHFPATWGAFRAKSFEAGPLRTVPGKDVKYPTSDRENNGAFAAPGKLLPVSWAENTNYFRDIVFVPAKTEAKPE